MLWSDNALVPSSRTSVCVVRMTTDDITTRPAVAWDGRSTWCAAKVGTLFL